MTAGEHLPVKKKQKAQSSEWLAPGTCVRMVRPNLWDGCEGVVESKTEDFQIVRVTRMDGTSFQIGALRAELNVLPADTNGSPTLNYYFLFPNAE